jgi:hypothetical protein
VGTLVKQSYRDYEFGHLIDKIIVFNSYQCCSNEMKVVGFACHMPVTNPRYVFDTKCQLCGNKKKICVEEIMASRVKVKK